MFPGPDIFGWTPVHYGFLTQSEFLNQVLIDYIDETKEGPRFHKLLDNLGRSPLHIAALAGRQSALEYALALLSDEEKKAAFSNKNRDGMTLLHPAVRSEDTQKIDYILENAPILQGIDDAWGRKAIHIAAIIGNPDITEALVSKGSGVGHLDEMKMSPVDYLLRSKPIEDEGGGVVEGRSHSLMKERCLILRQFARGQPAYRDSEGKTFLHIAAQFADVDTIEALRKAKDFIPEAIEERDAQRRTPLHCAILGGNTGVAIALLDISVDPPAKDINGTSVLMLAASQNMGVVVERLFSLAAEAEERG